MSPKLPSPTPVLRPRRGEGGERDLGGKVGMQGAMCTGLTQTPHFPPGLYPTMARAVVVNAAQLASYSQSKQFLLDSGEFRVGVCHGEIPNPGALSPRSPLTFWGAPRAFP